MNVLEYFPSKSQRELNRVLYSLTSSISSFIRSILKYQADNTHTHTCLHRHKSLQLHVWIVVVYIWNGSEIVVTQSDTKTESFVWLSSFHYKKFLCWLTTRHEGRWRQLKIDCHNAVGPIITHRAQAGFVYRPTLIVSFEYDVVWTRLMHNRTKQLTRMFNRDSKTLTKSSTIPLRETSDAVIDRWLTISAVVSIARYETYIAKSNSISFQTYSFLDFGSHCPIVSYLNWIFEML